MKAAILVVSCGTIVGAAFGLLVYVIIMALTCSGG